MQLDPRFRIALPETEEERIVEGRKWATGKSEHDQRYLQFARVLSAVDGTLIPNRQTDGEVSLAKLPIEPERYLLSSFPGPLLTDLRKGFVGMNCVMGCNADRMFNVAIIGAEG